MSIFFTGIFFLLAYYRLLVVVRRGFYAIYDFRLSHIREILDVFNEAEVRIP
jgi:hypothetical protein